MKRDNEFPVHGHDTNHDFVYDVFDFMKEKGNIKIETIINDDDARVTFKVNEFMNEDGYEKSLRFSKKNIIDELKNYLVFYPIEEQKAILEKLRFKLVLIWEYVIGTEQCADEKNNVVSRNKFIHCDDPKGFFSHYRNYANYVRIWMEVYNSILKDLKELIDDIDSRGSEDASNEGRSVDASPNGYDAKLKMHINVSQFTFLILTMMENKMIDDSNKMNNARCIAYHFLFDEKDANKEVDLEKRVDYIYNLFTTLNKNTVNFWDEKYLNFRQYTQELLRKL